MEIITLRFDNNEESCKSLVWIDNEFFCFILEDTVRDKKIKSVTAIPKGKYQVKFREIPSPKTTSYREKYDWFTFHLHLQLVPNYKYVYIHIGNNAGDSDGCLLVNNISYADANHMGQSADTFRKFYQKVKSELDRDKKVTIEIREISNLRRFKNEDKIQT